MNKTQNIKNNIKIGVLLYRKALKRWHYSCLFIFLFSACVSSNNKNIAINNKAFSQIDSLKQWLKSGDIIVRNGMDEVSMATRRFNRQDTSYSHCGIIQLENDTAFVYHALGGSYNPSQVLMRQPVDSFCNPSEVSAFAVYRLQLTNTQNSELTSVIKTHYTSRLPFDMFFNYDSDDKMYCSEFVFKSINAAAGNYLLGFHPRNQPMYVTVDDLYLNPSAKLIKQIKF